MKQLLKLGQPAYTEYTAKQMAELLMEHNEDDFKEVLRSMVKIVAKELKVRNTGTLRDYARRKELIELLEK